MAKISTKGCRQGSDASVHTDKSVGRELMCNQPHIGPFFSFMNSVIKEAKGGRYGQIFVYDTPITDDVLGFLDKDEVLETLREIQALPRK